jgi:predicted DNA-binding transcriptional regulator AlpA
MGDVPPLRFVHAADADAPLVVDAKRLAKLLGCGLRTVRSWNATGKLPKPIRIGGRVLWYLPEIRSWIECGSPSRETWDRIKPTPLK